MKVDVVGPDASLWHGEATSVSVPAADGEMGIRTGHQPVLAVLKAGPVRIIPVSGEQVNVDVLGGFVSVDDDVVMVVVDAHDERRAEDAQAASGE
ncbi:F0F1 ATP synthase subunit epsilon [Georgenia wangjunii]|uniref:F0F1 ATP synthase subunit epsilon n=1 Tax=Georgenia wangjunii TaxID=3117730 RepID=UPI002F2678ED